MTIEYEIEPIPGLPGNLPAGETIVWQGSPDWQTLARAVFHTRLVAVWFVFVASLAFVAGGTGLKGALVTLLAAGLGLGVLYFLARASSRSTIYTLTSRRVVMRFGVALPKCINLPLKAIGAADVRNLGNGRVDIVLRPTDRFPLGWLQMWPHVQPWKVASPQPMLRAVPESFVPILAEALRGADPVQTSTVELAPQAAGSHVELSSPAIGVAA
ncbi:PH domain-containing protein [Polymorphobacter fuscus]|uniref:PH domain-containing protein n=1 Tax=Sandarakinorhabdus fusca TaxID=1439888 RepID=A0A7C9GQ82_9SPHN|nr:PH domain-containing protein [Polymorphobacter fuscus]MQT18137.1 PH domain-containing protein [Polymorphobacter fuscus]